ncbi:MAG: hypothetical protein IJL56_00860 [Bacteroidales bacterium]|nr:hypothetical protein [Bacteroidales bacterium]
MKKGLILILALFLALTAAAQHRRIPYYGFARLDRNRIQYPSGKSPDFDLFLRKLDTLSVYGKASVRVLHVGGSHVQGGTWTQQLRRNFMTMRYGMDGGRGMVFPFSAAGTNTPSGYATEYTGEWTFSRCLKPEADIPLGITGMSVTTADSTATFLIDTAERNPREWAPRFMFRDVEVLGFGSARPVILMDRDTLEGTPSKYGWHFDLPHYTNYLSVAFRGFPGQCTVTGIYLDRPGGGITISEAGVNGAATSSWVACRDFERDLELVRPDLVIFSVGINDVQEADFNQDRFIRNYNRLIAEVRKVNPHCAILFTSNNDSYRNRLPNRHGEAAEMAFARLAVENDAAFWDLFDIMGGAGSSLSWEGAGLMRGDRVHFTSAGYDLLGDLLFNAIMDARRRMR